MAETLTIEALRKGGKSWRVECLGLITADAYWPVPAGKAYWPVYLCIAERDEVVRGFLAHFKAGRTATLRSRHGHEEPRQVAHHDRIEWAEPQRTSGGITIATAWLPDLCRLDPGRMQDRVRFLLAPSAAWVEDQIASPLLAELGDKALRIDAAVGSLFAAFAGARTAWPIIPDPLFHAALWRAAQAWCVAPSGTSGYPGGVWWYPREGPAGIPSAVVFDCQHQAWEAMLRTETRRFLEAHGAERVTATHHHQSRPRRAGRRVRVTGDLYHGVVPAGAVYIGRAAPGLPASPWQNPFRVKDHGAGALPLFQRHLDEHPELVARARAELAGKDLACWCKLDEPCHGDEWLRRLAVEEASCPENIASSRTATEPRANAPSAPATAAFPRATTTGSSNATSASEPAASFVPTRRGPSASPAAGSESMAMIPASRAVVPDVRSVPDHKEVPLVPKVEPWQPSLFD